MAKVELKQPVVSEIKELLEGAETAVVVDYRGITVAQDTELRKKLREAGISYKVYKNTMIRFAAKGTDFEALGPVLEGPTAIAVSKTDATAPARILAEFAKKAPALEIKGGVVEGVFYDAKAMEKISNIPSREILLGKLLEASSLLLQTLHVFSSRLQTDRAQKHNFLDESKPSAA